MKAGIIGATGYAGVELFRILLRHPGIEKIYASSVSFEGQRIDSVYQNLLGQLGDKSDGMLLTADEVKEKSDILFTALPHGIAEQYADWCVKNGKKLIDLSADFRYGMDEATFKTWYKKDWQFPEVHKECVYGSPEMNREMIKKARIIGNPGCYVTSATLGLLPALKSGLVDTSAPLIVDSKSGVTGSGRNATMTNHFCECGESLSAYKVGNHRHQSEIQRNFALIAGKEPSDLSVIFTPQLIPMNRGILSTVYAPLSAKGMQAAASGLAAIRSIYEETYKGEPFVRVLPEGVQATTRTIRGTNYCDMQIYLVNGGKMLEIVSVLDNMVKGASGQAVQNMNLMYGFDERTGLDFIPASF
ncbi:MAG: N-acetyl-gamma-glutamyl-phosphate reductase [Treponema sp.]|nr:N-acetyl-gamma-glutamyl-phosphate reductase [Treponema sp.]